MANLLEYVPILQAELDKAAVETATTGWMEPNSSQIKYQGGREVKLPIIDMDGLGDYDPDNGFVDGDVTLKYQTFEMTQDRGRRFGFDEHEVNDTNFIVTASTVMGEFQRTKVVPEIDAYRYSKVAALAMAHERASYGYTPAEADILKKLYYDIAAVQDAVGSDIPLIITMSRTVSAIFDMNKDLSKSIGTGDFKQGNISLKVKTLNDEHPIIRVGSGKLKTAFQFLDGKSEDQKKGGFIPATSALDINWIICPRTAPIACSRTDKMRVFDPETNQQKRSWAMDYRRYHDLWIKESAFPSILVNIKQEKPAGGGA